MSVKFPYHIDEVDEIINQELLEYFQGRKSGFIQVGPKKWLLPKKYGNHADKYYNFEVRKDDLWIVTYPRSGTTLNSELLWLINNNLDYTTAAKIPLSERVPFFEFNIVSDDAFLKEVAELNGHSAKALEEIKKRNTPGYEIGDKMMSPRHFKTHLPLSLLPPSLVDTCKVVYIARNPMDVSISFYHHNKKIRAHNFQGDFQKYWDFFEKDLVIYTPYWEHIKEGWEMKSHPNLYFLFYEDLIKDKSATIKGISKFLNKEMSDDDLNRLIEHTNYDNFQKNIPIGNVGGGIGKGSGIVGLVNQDVKESTQRGKIGGKEEFNSNVKLRERAEKWFKKHSSEIGIDFPI